MRAGLRLLVPLVACLALVAPPSPSASGADDCVTSAENRQARYGMSKARVHRIFGTNGRRLYLVAHNEEKRVYRMCDGRSLTITYLHGELAYRRVSDADGR